MKSQKLIGLIFSLATSPIQAQDLDYHIEAQSAFSNRETPLWLNANAFGLSSLEKSNGYVRAGVFKRMQDEVKTEDEVSDVDLPAKKVRKWDWAAGMDMAVAVHYTSKVIVQQAYMEGRWRHGVLSLGAKEYPMQMKNNRLSSGSQTLGINARPVPQIRLALPEYTRLLKWLYLKGHIAYGWMTDSKWQENFADPNSKWAKNMLLHTKAGYLRWGNPTSHLTVETGIEMACQFGGTSYKNGKATKRGAGLKDYWQAFLPGGEGDLGEGVYANVEGNNLGSLLMRITWDEPSWRAAFYADHFFDDHSQMIFLDFDGYGDSEDNFRTHEQHRYIFYTPRDIMFGGEVNLKLGRWLKDIVVEYIHTKDQSGAVYHDSEPGLAAHVAGRDDYYNHYFYPGWQHWGQTMGNPLYRSPIYNTNGQIDFEDTRFVAWHLGLSGQPTKKVDYRILATLQKGWGTYSDPYVPLRRNFSAMIEAGYRFPEGWQVRGAIGLDRGEILDNNIGFRLTVSKSGIFHF